MASSMKRQTALIWGAAGGIGRALAAHLVASGWQVLAVARRAETLAGLTPHVFEADVTVLPQVEAAVAAIAQEVEAVDLFAYTAGDIAAAPVARLTPADWQRILAANLTGAFLTTHASLPLLAPEAHLVFVGAISERLRLPGLSAYAAAKVGLEAFAAVLAKEERRRRVTVVRPAAVDTPFWERSPFRKPAGALSPEIVADRILAAYRDGHSGTLDLSE
jgi:3-oxoacyl-[acyl-carrier protein] reductase